MLLDCTNVNMVQLWFWWPPQSQENSRSSCFKSMCSLSFLSLEASNLVLMILSSSCDRPNVYQQTRHLCRMMDVWYAKYDFGKRDLDPKDASASKSIRRKGKNWGNASNWKASFVTGCDQLHLPTGFFKHPFPSSAKDLTICLRWSAEYRRIWSNLFDHSACTPVWSMVANS